VFRCFTGFASLGAEAFSAPGFPPVSLFHRLVQFVAAALETAKPLAG
jgi:hypothetical protein